MSKWALGAVRSGQSSAPAAWPHEETLHPEVGGYVDPGVGLDATGTAGNKPRLSGCPTSHRLLSEPSQFDST